MTLKPAPTPSHESALARDPQAQPQGRQIPVPAIFYIVPRCIYKSTRIKLAYTPTP